MRRFIMAAVLGLALWAIGSFNICQAEVPSTSDASFKNDVLNSKEPVLVDFYATWCGPCKKMAPVIDELSSEYANKVKFLRVDVDTNNKLAAEFKINSIPTFITYKNGKAVDRIVGLSPKTELSKKLDSLLQ